jgi:hypothetical protein
MSCSRVAFAWVHDGCRGCCETTAVPSIASGPTADAPHGHRCVGTEAADEPGVGRAHDISVSAPPPADRPAEPGMRRGHSLRTHGRGLRDSLLKAITHKRNYTRFPTFSPADRAWFGCQQRLRRYASCRSGTTLFAGWAMRSISTASFSSASNFSGRYSQRS